MIPRGIEVLWEQRDAMLSGLLTTLAITVVAAVCAGLLGLTLFALLISRFRAVPLVLAWLIDLMRCVPFMLFCYTIYYGLPSFGIVIDNMTAGIAALTVYNAAYIAELLRGSFVALPPEASRQVTPSASMAGGCFCVSSCPRCCWPRSQCSATRWCRSSRTAPFW